jgi:hypothetical protein
MADWPTTDELKQVLNVDTDGDNWSTTLVRVLEWAIERVKLDVGAWVEETDVPTSSLAQAALRMAELIALRPESAATAGANDPTYHRLLKGHRRRFAVS